MQGYTYERIPRNAGLLGLEQEVQQTASDQLLEQVSLLIEVSPDLWTIVRPRLRLAVWELQRRASDDRPVAA